MEFLEAVLHSFINLAILLFEYIGVCVITFAGIQGIVNYVRRRPDTKLVLAKGLAMGLEFKLGSEILRTVVVRRLEEIYIVAGIIALRAILTILIHWEIKNEENEEHRYDAAERPAAAEEKPEPKIAVPESRPEREAAAAEEKPEPEAAAPEDESGQKAAAPAP